MQVVIVRCKCCSAFALISKMFGDNAHELSENTARGLALNGAGGCNIEFDNISILSQGEGILFRDVPSFAIDSDTLWTCSRAC